MKKAITLIVLLLLTVFLGACDKNKDTNTADGPKVSIYYIDSKTSALVSEEYQLISSDKKEQIEELLYMLKKNPENLHYKSAMPETVTIKEFAMNEDGSLTINFDTTYTELTGIPEVLCRAAIVKTLSQLQGVEYFQLTVNGQPLMDSSGKLVGIMTKEDFVDNTGTTTKAKLYFANEAGDALVEDVRDISYTGTGSLEELVLEELIAGPDDIGIRRTIPEGTVLNKVEMKEGICYVDFNEKFLNKQADITDQVAIYSVVNTLVELPYIKKVQFLINGQVQSVYGDGTTFDVFFERNLALMEES